MASHSQAQASYCSGLTAKVDNTLLYAEVLSSRSHLEMDLVVVSKQNSYNTSKIRVKGGAGYDAKTVPSCDSNGSAGVEWINSYFARHITHSYNSWQATYRLCLYDIRNQLKVSYVVCNSNTGD